MQKYPSINGLRAISILLVVCNHIGLQSNFFVPFEKIKLIAPFIYFIQDGHLGVNIFFVISGFLITALLLQEEEATKTIGLKNFYIRRMLRIFPAYYFLLLIYFILQLAGYLYINKASWLTALTFTKYFNYRLDWFTAHTWSLSVEEGFYLFWPLIFLAGKKVRVLFVAVLIIIVPFVRLYINSNVVGWINDNSIFTRIDAIATGCLCAFYKDWLLSKIKKYRKYFFYFSVILLFLLRYLPYQFKKIGADFIFVPLGTTHGTIANILIAFILLYIITTENSLFYKFLNLKPVVYIGLLSYSIYLWQQVFISEEGVWVNKLPQNLLFIAITALFSYHFIEKPFLRLKSRFYPK